MTTEYQGRQTVQTTVGVYVVKCDGCGASRPAQGNHEWLQLSWPWLDEHTYWYDGCNEGPWDFCTPACMKGFIDAHRDALSDSAVNGQPATAEGEAIGPITVTPSSET